MKKSADAMSSATHHRSEGLASSTAGSSQFRTIRWVVVFVALVALVATAPYVFDLLWFAIGGDAARSQIKAFEFSEAFKEAFTSQLALSSTLFQTAVALIAGIWALVVVKKDESPVQFDELPERLLLVLATLCLLSSCVSHIFFVQDMSGHAVDSAGTNRMPDITHRQVAHGLVAQASSLMAGAAIGAGAILSASWLKGKRV